MAAYARQGQDISLYTGAAGGVGGGKGEDDGRCAAHWWLNVTDVKDCAIKNAHDVLKIPF
jgi:hypothetical protein